MYRIVWKASAGMWAALLLMVSGVAWGQTQVSLKTQSKLVDFSSAAFTKPLQTGISLPPTCTVGQMFFNTSAAAGQNIYGCASTNIWTLQSGGSSGSGGSGSGLTIQSGTTTVGTRSILSMSPGLGTIFSLNDTGTAIALQASVDTAIVETLAASQSGSALYCNSSSGSGAAYTCSMNPSLIAYTTGMVIHWKPDVNSTGGATSLAIDAQGAVAVKLADGATDPGPNDLVAGRMQEIWYDGARFRLMAMPLPEGALGEAQPACSATTRGRTWFVAGSTGVKDSFSVCAKDASNNYAWRALY
jgi:hypothetical protein